MRLRRYADYEKIAGNIFIREGIGDVTAETIAEAAEYLSDTTIAKLHKYNQLVEPLKDRQLFYKDANEWRDQYWAKLIEFKP